jgi:hypothetical protein
MSLITQIHNQYEWEKWYKSYIELPNGDLIRVRLWIHNFLFKEIFPELENKGYILTISPTKMYECFMRFSFKLYMEYKRKNHRAIVICNHILSNHNIVDDDYYYFHEQFPPSYWEDLKYRWKVDMFMDDSIFSNIFIENIPEFIASHIDYVNSPFSSQFRDVYDSDIDCYDNIYIDKDKTSDNYKNNNINITEIVADRSDKHDWDRI